MCNGFSTIVTRDGRILWVEPDVVGNISHHDILRRAKLSEDTEPLGNRQFVRAEIPSWEDEHSFHWDENGSLPVWLVEDEVQEKVIKLWLRVKEIYDLGLPLEKAVERYSKLPGFLMGEPIYSSGKEFYGKVLDIPEDTQAITTSHRDTFTREMRNLVGKSILLSPHASLSNEKWYRGANLNWHKSWIKISQSISENLIIGYK